MNMPSLVCTAIDSFAVPVIMRIIASSLVAGYKYSQEYVIRQLCNPGTTSTLKVQLHPP